LLIGNNSNAKRIYIIDYGLSTVYGSNKSPPRMCNESEQEEVISKFGSVGAHQGNKQKAKDDLESIGYLLLYFLKGNLPWYSLDPKSSKEKIIDMKKSASNELQGKEIYSKELNYHR
jgi:hypothetical protein